MSNQHSCDEQQTAGFGLLVQTHGVASHKLIRMAIAGLSRLQQTASARLEPIPGCGLLLQKPDTFFRALAESAGWNLSRRYAVGMLFLSQDPLRAAESRRIVAEELAKETLSLVGWRSVPVNPRVLTPAAQAALPRIEQLFVNAPPGWVMKDLDRRLYVARRRIEKRLAPLDPDFYVASLSNQVIVYKGWCQAADLPRFYLDLADIRLQSAICLFHKGTMPAGPVDWRHVQPHRFLAHSGHITTLAGNRQWAQARAYKFASPLLPDLQTAAPFVNQDDTGAASLDNMLELFLAGGLDLFRAVRLLVPPAWTHHPDIDVELKAFYDFNSMHMEPWEGPGALLMSDGRFAACALDRHGRRPARYLLTHDKILMLASESGIWDCSPDEVAEKGRVGAGELLVVDTYTAKLWSNFEIDNDLKHRHPYQEWLTEHRRVLLPFDAMADTQIGCRELDDVSLRRNQQLFALSQEAIAELQQSLLSAPSSTATRCHAGDVVYRHLLPCSAPLGVMPLNPVLDRPMMSLTTCMGREQNVFNETYGHAHRLQFSSPLLQFSDLRQLQSLDDTHYSFEVLDMTFEAAEGLVSALDRLSLQALEAVRRGIVLLILSDRIAEPLRLPIPAVLATAAVQQALVAAQLRCDCNLILDTGSVSSAHHAAILLGCGATAIYPYLAYETLASLVESGQLALTLRQTLQRYRQHLEEGLYRALARLGIGSLASFRCARLFEISGLAVEVSRRCFPGIACEPGNLDFARLTRMLLQQRDGIAVASAPAETRTRSAADDRPAAPEQPWHPLLSRLHTVAARLEAEEVCRLQAERTNVTPQRLIAAAEIQIDLLAKHDAEPPQHRDLGSLPALAQLLYELRILNPVARLTLRMELQPGLECHVASLIQAGIQRLSLVVGADAVTPGPCTDQRWSTALSRLHDWLSEQGCRQALQLQLETERLPADHLLHAFAQGADNIVLPISATERLTLAEQLWPEMVRLGLAPPTGEPTEHQGTVTESAAPLAMPAGRLEQQLRRELAPALATAQGGDYHFVIDNLDRAIAVWLTAARLSGIARPQPQPPMTLNFDGSAGDGFGSWNSDGIQLRLTGDANNHVGRGMAGGELVIRPHLGVSFRSEDAVLLGDHALYGATGGRLFAAGRAGDYFAACNQGASAVVEGVGDHACEAMCAGTVLILGTVGINLAAGLRGGMIIVHDPQHKLTSRQAPLSPRPVPLTALPEVQAILHSLLHAHLDATGSVLAKTVLADLPSHLSSFMVITAAATSPSV